ncbi:GNAT family N-acetyltransferase [Pseudalkalibacillus caeni]|uniref:GNAT family N-acetyltransferase n=1 Tax=Exobacillus caeni TaxID=2574798 RepID=A0A5R9F8S1_9BACL|nr:GNAT family N-acetyltransferase [Pseudalkalibacillus caeni]TLS36924.1 GNAT family N-acetyltransferase [Pseudalkalibacillus caeni]
MVIQPGDFAVRDLSYVIRSAEEKDAEMLSEVRLQADGETENLDREKGEAVIDEPGFKKLIKEDTESRNNLFLVAEVNGRIAGFARCEGSKLKRFSHKVEFGVAVLKDYWGYKMGEKLLAACIHWADSNEIKKMTLSVLETNEKAIKLYKKYGFEVEGILKGDKVLSDGNYYGTIIMGRLNQE